MPSQCPERNLHLLRGHQIPSKQDTANEMFSGNSVYWTTLILIIKGFQSTAENASSITPKCEIERSWLAHAGNITHSHEHQELGGGGGAEKIHLFGMGSIGYDHMLAGSRIHMNKVYGPEKRTA